MTFKDFKKLSLDDYKLLSPEEKVQYDKYKTLQNHLENAKTKKKKDKTRAKTKAAKKMKQKQRRK